jgi:hypothetical protein
MAEMAGYAARTNGSVWYDEQGSGDPLVLLHGGAVDARSFEQNVGGLAIVPLRRSQPGPVS